MGTAYAIYDTETANLIDTFLTEAEALAMVKRAVDEDGSDSVRGWARGQTDHMGNVFAGREFVERAKRAAG